MAFKTLDEFLGDSLDLPVKCRDGKVRTFHIPACSAEDGLRVEALMQAGLRMAADGSEPDAELLDDAAEMDLYRIALGEAHDDVRAHLDWPRFRHVALTAVMWITQGLDTAERYWNSGGDPSQLGPAANREQRRASSRAEKSTPSRASRSGTSTPRATSRARKAAST
jgi:hypothetical protein